MPTAILALNAGSSRGRFGLFEGEDGGRLWMVSKGEIAGIGLGPHCVAWDAGETMLEETRWAQGTTMAASSCWPERLNPHG